MKQPYTTRAPTANPPSTPMIKNTITRITSTVVLTRAVVGLEELEFVDKPERNQIKLLEKSHIEFLSNIVGQ